MHKFQPMYQNDAMCNSSSPCGKVKKSTLGNYRPYNLRSPNMKANAYATVRSNGKMLEHLDTQHKLIESYNQHFENSNDNPNLDILGEDKNSRYKTEMCRNFKERAYCMYGDQCQFAHGREELRDALRNNKYKTKTCQKYWVTGYCAYGPRCNFVHFENTENCDIKSSMSSNSQLLTEFEKQKFSFSSEMSPATSDEELVDTVAEVYREGRAMLSQLERDNKIYDPNLDDLLEKLKRALPPKRSSTPLLDISKSNGSSTSDISRTSPVALENDYFKDQYNSNWIYGDGIANEHNSFESRGNTYKNWNQRVMDPLALSKFARERDMFSLISASSKKSTSPNKMITQ